MVKQRHEWAADYAARRAADKVLPRRGPLQQAPRDFPPTDIYANTLIRPRARASRRPRTSGARPRSAVLAARPLLPRPPSHCSAGPSGPVGPLAGRRPPPGAQAEGGGAPGGGGRVASGGARPQPAQRARARRRRALPRPRLRRRRPRGRGAPASAAGRRRVCGRAKKPLAAAAPHGGIRPVLTRGLQRRRAGRGSGARGGCRVDLTGPA